MSDELYGFVATDTLHVCMAVAALKLFGSKVPSGAGYRVQADMLYASISLSRSFPTSHHLIPKVQLNPELVP